MGDTLEYRVFWYWAFGTIPWIGVPFAFLDVAFLAFFVAALKATGPSR